MHWARIAVDAGGCVRCMPTHCVCPNALAGWLIAALASKLCEPAAGATWQLEAALSSPQAPEATAAQAYYMHIAMPSTEATEPAH